MLVKLLGYGKAALGVNRDEFAGDDDIPSAIHVLPAEVLRARHGASLQVTTES